MSLYNSFDRNAHFAETNDPLDTQSGVLTPTVRKNTATKNLLGGAVVSDAAVQLPSNVASGGTLAVHVTQVMSHSLRIKSLDGTLYYVMLTNVVTNRTGGA